METILKQYQAIIFDMDGVIVNSLDFWKMTEEKMLQKFGITKDLSLFQPTEAMSTKEAITFWLSKYPQQNVSLEDIEQFVIDEMTHLIQSNDCINKEIYNLILKLHQEYHILGLATNSPKKIMNVVLEKANLLSIFKAVVTADDVKQVKPNSEIYLKIAQLLNVSPSKCIVIEDSDYGIKAAKNAGMDVIKII